LPLGTYLSVYSLFWLLSFSSFNRKWGWKEKKHTLKIIMEGTRRSGGSSMAVRYI